jgi:imidazolonepropionase-like amidohydrolase
MNGTLFGNVMIFDGTGTGLFPGEVLVRDQRIEAVARGVERLPREGVIEIDGAGRTLMPGLVDGHSHLTWPTSV